MTAWTFGLFRGVARFSCHLGRWRVKGFAGVAKIVVNKRPILRHTMPTAREWSQPIAGNTQMNIIHTTTFRTFHQGVIVTLSLRQDGANFIVRCQPRGYPLNSTYDTACASLAEANTIYTQKYSIGMVGSA